MIIEKKWISFWDIIRASFYEINYSLVSPSKRPLFASLVLFLFVRTDRIRKIVTPSFTILIIIFQKICNDIRCFCLHNPIIEGNKNCAFEKL